jgi:predicted nucleic acid-binding protein
MSGNKFVLDTNAAINYLNGRISLEEESKAAAFLRDNVTIIEIDAPIKRETIAIRRSTKIKLPDCIIAATSVVLGATLLTHDLDDLLPLAYPGFYARDIS